MKIFKNMMILLTPHISEERSSDPSRSWQKLICALIKIIIFLMKMYFSLLLKGVEMEWGKVKLN